MISLLGRGLVMAALFFATTGCLTGFVAGSRRSAEAWNWTRRLALGFAGTMVAANLLMVYALISHDFSVQYVAEVGSTTTPLYFTIVSLWASLNGSILFWGGVLAVYTAALVLYVGDRHREYMPWTLHVQLGIAVFFCLLVASIANPFAPTPDHVLQNIGSGPGPNPLLQNHWLMAIHPPLLYLGYVGMSVPFSMICAALLNGRLESGWMAPLRRGMLVPWIFLTIGINLGGWWSYAVLGWGGAWAWDPVENASFHPWLTATAFLHSAMILERRRWLQTWTLILGMATFLLTLLGTFMTRSGVFNSVHSFTQSEIGPVFLVFIFITFSYSIVLLAFRSHLLEEATEAAAKKLGRLDSSRRSLASMFTGREVAIVIQNALFTVWTFVVLQGTLWPLIKESVEGRQISVGEPYFDKWALPLGLALVFMMGVGPALPWGGSSPGRAAKRLAGPLLTGAIFTAVWAAFGVQKPFAMLAIFTCGFALHGNLGELVEPVLARIRKRKEPPHVAFARVWGRARRRFGGHIAHYGVILAVFSLALSKGYRFEADYHVTQGESISFQGYDLQYTGIEVLQEPQRRSRLATFQLSRDGRQLQKMDPRLNFYTTQREPIPSPSVYSTLSTDIYLSIIEVEDGNDGVVIRAIENPWQVWLWISAPVMALGTILAVWPARRRERRPADKPPAEAQPA